MGLALPLHVQEICLDASADQVVVGRAHQTQLFDAMLPDWLARYGAHVSRSHAQLRIVGSQLLVTNLSSNPLYVDQKPVMQGGTYELGQGQLLSFARTEESESNVASECSLVHFLKLRAEGHVSPKLQDMNGCASQGLAGAKRKRDGIADLSPEKKLRKDPPSQPSSLEVIQKIYEEEALEARDVHVDGRRDRVTESCR